MLTPNTKAVCLTITVAKHRKKTRLISKYFLGSRFLKICWIVYFPRLFCCQVRSQISQLSINGQRFTIFLFPYEVAQIVSLNNLQWRKFKLTPKLYFMSHHSFLCEWNDVNLNVMKWSGECLKFKPLWRNRLTIFGDGSFHGSDRSFHED